MYRPLDQVSHDMRFALRQFRRAPGLTLAAVLALACGIGGMTTAFTLIDAVVLRPLPVTAPDELVSLRDPSFSYPMFEQIRDRAHMLRGVFAWEPRMPRRVVYVPYMQTPQILKASSLYAEIRTAESRSIGEALQAAVRSLDATAPIRIETVRGRIDESLVQERLVTVIAIFLGGVSLLLACGALGGLMSHMVASRTSEIGLRIALGAERHAVTALVMREALALALVGAVAGVGLALAGGRLVAGFLHSLQPTDPVAVGAAAALMLLTATVTGYLPARRAARIDPVEALRSE